MIIILNPFIMLSYYVNPSLCFSGSPDGIKSFLQFVGMLYSQRQPVDAIINTPLQVPTLEKGTEHCLKISVCMLLEPIVNSFGSRASNVALCLGTKLCRGLGTRLNYLADTASGRRHRFRSSTPRPTCVG